MLLKRLNSIEYQRDISDDLSLLNAKFIYFFDTQKMEGRSFDNDGKSEDVATGSAAGPAAGWLYRNNVRHNREELCINQGSFLGRPSKINTQIYLNHEGSIAVRVSAPVCFVAEGIIYEEHLSHQ